MGERGVEAVPAATVVVLRRADSRMEVLLLHKVAGHAFGDMWVFPGGRVDPSDGAPDDDECERARHAAVRETHEESGIRLTADDFVPFAHWTPPPEAPRRFATWFFIVEVPHDIGDVLVDGAEIRDHAWMTPADALAGHARRDFQLATPTWLTLYELASFADPSEAIEAARGSGVAYYATRLADLDGTLVALWEGDAGYETADVGLSGGRHRLSMPTTGAWTYERTDG